MPETSPQRRRASAREVFRDYGITSLALILWEIWCVRDGWLNPGYEHIAFSRAMAYISTPFLLYTAVMAVSAGLTVQKQKKSPPQS